MSKAAIEVITSVQRRRCWSAAEKERLVAASLSVLWLVGSSVWLWISNVGDRHEWYQMDELRSHVWKIMAVVNAGVLAAIWLLVFVGVPVGRWVAAALRTWA
jgi:hypothetical protein